MLISFREQLAVAVSRASNALPVSITFDALSGGVRT
jgi:hypothetical protein